MAHLLYLMAFINDTPHVGPYHYDKNNHHITILQEFSLKNENAQPWINQLYKINNWFTPITVKTQKLIYLGENFDIPAITITDPTNELHNLHTTINHSLQTFGGKTTQPEHTNNNYLPHISHYPLLPQQKITIHGYSLIEHVDGFGKNVNVVENFTLK